MAGQDLKAVLKLAFVEVMQECGLLPGVAPQSTPQQLPPAQPSLGVPAIAATNPVAAPSDLPPGYPILDATMFNGIHTLDQAWQVYVGINGRLGVRELNQLYKDRWRCAPKNPKSGTVRSAYCGFMSVIRWMEAVAAANCVTVEDYMPAFTAWQNKHAEFNSVSKVKVWLSKSKTSKPKSLLPGQPLPDPTPCSSEKSNQASRGDLAAGELAPRNLADGPDFAAAAGNSSQPASSGAAPLQQLTGNHVAALLQLANMLQLASSMSHPTARPAVAPPSPVQPPPKKKRMRAWTLFQIEQSPHHKGADGKVNQTAVRNAYHGLSTEQLAEYERRAMQMNEGQIPMVESVRDRKRIKTAR